MPLLQIPTGHLQVKESFKLPVKHTAENDCINDEETCTVINNIVSKRNIQFVYLPSILLSFKNKTGC